MNISWSLHDIFVQSLGFLSFIIYMVAYQIKDTRKTQMMFAPGSALYGLQYLFLGSTSAAVMMFSAAMRDLVAARASDRILKAYSAIHLIVIWGGIALLSYAWQEWLIAISSTISTVAALFREHFYKFRFLLLARQFIKMLFNIWVQSYAGILHLLVTLISNAIGIYRHHRQQKGEGTTSKPIPGDE